MSSTEFDLEAFLGSSGVDENSALGFIDEPTEVSDGTSYFEPGYEGKIDPRIRQLSYSSLLTLHSCPRKFQLSRLRTTHKAEESLKSTITFSYGHVVGEGIQKILEGWTEDQVIWHMFLGWHTQSLFDCDEKLNKSFWTAIIAIQRLFSMRAGGFLNDYELVWHNGVPACELSFCVNFPDGFRLRGFVDAVLRHKTSGQVIVLECKTTGASTLNPATYKNSAQAIGYSIVLDVLFPDLSSYDVLYLIYQTKSQEFTTFNFTKTYLQRALWIRELLLDIEMIKLYSDAEVFPMHGESCVTFGRDCEYLQSCGLSTSYLTKPCKVEDLDTTEYQINLTLADLLEAQLEKTT